MTLALADFTPAAARTAKEGFGIYVHWPFCQSKCPYCDFNSHVRDHVDEVRWRRALLAELGHFAAETAGRTVTSVFFGGGTPSLMAPETVQAVLDRIYGLWPVAPTVEVTMEANPSSVEAGRFAAVRAAGVNRVSLGVQALDDRALAALGRRHDQAEARAAVAMAARCFPRFSFDLIYARPGQTVAKWRAELRGALALCGEHLSLYQLTIEPGTAFHAAHARGALVLPDEDVSVALYEETQAVMEAAGMPAYEVSNHARPGAECRHNLVYWRCGDYLGIGPGAHGRVGAAGGRTALRQRRAPETWLAAVEAEGHGVQERLPLSDDERLEELLMMGLRLIDGIDRERFRHALGRDIEDTLDGPRLDRLREGGFLILDAAGLRATPAGRQCLNAVLADLLAN